jgi:hypothetical protein
LVAAGESEKETCAQSLELLQITSSVHGVTERGADCGGHAPQTAAVSGQTVRSPLTLLQVSARTGEVAQFASSQHEEDSGSPHRITIPTPDHQAITAERRRDITSLLKQGGGSDEVEGSEAPVVHEAAGTQAHAGDLQKGSSEGTVEGKPDAQVLQGARIAPFGKEDTARELQHHAARTQDTLVDAIENAEVAEIKRSIFRSLTRLRAAEIKEFDTIARLETQAIDEYNDNHHYRAENPLDYIHSAEVGVKEDKYTSFHD